MNGIETRSQFNIIFNSAMKDCPIGLICEFFDCDQDRSRGYCEDLAKPWPLPYDINPCWLPGVGLLATLPGYDWHCPNIEYLILENENYNNWVSRVREDYWLGGWWDATDLPYKPHPEGGLLVIHHLKLDEEITLSCPWRYDPRIPYGCSPTYWEEFMPPVPINGYGLSFTDKIEFDGFYRDWLMRWPSDFIEEDYGD